MKARLKTRARAITLVKLVAVLQILWLIIQLGVHLGKSLPVSQLEISAFSYAACALISYLLWLDKLQDVHLPLEINATINLRYEDLERVIFEASTRENPSGAVTSATLEATTSAASGTTQLATQDGETGQGEVGLNFSNAGGSWLKSMFGRADWVRNNLTPPIGNDASFSIVSTGIKLLGTGLYWLDLIRHRHDCRFCGLAAFTSLPSVFLIPRSMVCGLLGSALTASGRASSFSLQ